MIVTKISTLTGVTRTVDLPITQEQFDLWRGGVLIQKAMPHLSADEREFVLTGITPDEWEEFMGEEE